MREFGGEALKHIELIGTNTPMFYGDLDTDFSPYANLADVSIRELAYGGGVLRHLI